MTIVSKIIRSLAGITYEVWREDEGKQDLLYRNEVPFGQDEAHHAGGAAFRLAADEQRQHAARVVEHLLGSET